MNSRKEEDINNGTNDEKGSSSNPPSSSSSWSRLKDPRIVRVSRAFGGKDRHSKVCTIKGLRDRRVRLSVPTAIQLYDLQERLGLNQPSKVVDWLLDVAKNEIHELPPLQIPSDGNLIIDQNLIRSILASQSVGKQLIGSNISNPWISDTNNTLLGNKSKDDDVFHQTESSAHERIQDFRDAGVSLMNNSSISEQQFMRWDSSALSLAQSRNSGITNEDVHHHHHHQNQSFNVLPFMTSAETQVLVYQQQQQQQQQQHSSATTAISQSYFDSSNNLADTSASDNYVPKQFNFHMLDSTSENDQFPNPQDRRF